MQHPRNQKDTQNAIRELTNFKNTLTTKDLDLHGRKVTNAAPATNPTDYVILSQLPVSTQTTSVDNQFYSIPFNSTGSVLTGDQCAAYIVGKGREGIVYAVMIAAIVTPSTGDLKMNIQVKPAPPPTGTDNTMFADVLDKDIILPQGKIGPVISSTFKNPGLVIGYQCLVVPTITNGAGAGFVTIQLIVKRVDGVTP